MLDLVGGIGVGALEQEVIVVDNGSTDESARIVADRLARGTALRLAHLYALVRCRFGGQKGRPAIARQSSPDPAWGQGTIRG